MKTNLNQIGSPGAVAAIIGVVLLLNFPVLVKAADVLSSNIEPVAVTLQPGVTGVEIQQALDALPDPGGTVIFPADKILIRQPIVLRRDFQTLRGSGADTVLWLADDANCPAVIMGEPVNHPQ